MSNKEASEILSYMIRSSNNEDLSQALALGSAALASLITDSGRLEAAERMKLSIRYNAMTEKWEVVTGDLHPMHRRSFQKKTLRAAIDAAIE